MDRDELREKIKAIIIEAREEDHHGNLLMYSDEATDSILSLLAPELEKARRYDKADILIKQFKNSAPTDRHVIGLINAFIGIIETLGNSSMKVEVKDV